MNNIKNLNQSQVPSFEEAMDSIKRELRCPQCERLILNPYEKELVSGGQLCVDCMHDYQVRREDRL